MSTEPNEMKVFQLNDYDWYMAPTLEDAIEEAINLTGLDEDEVWDDGYGEMEKAELDRLWFVDEDGSRRTFREEFARRMASDPRTQLFASTEF